MSTGLSTVDQNQGSAMSIATTRQAAETQAAMIVAKQYPRDEINAIARIKKSCQRVSLAECSMYSYPKGGQQIVGPSIRLAEAMAQSWGNIDYGIIELSNKAGESSVMAYAWDLETNTRRQMVFSVPHIRTTRQGATLLTDPRDIYELIANQGARRVRACILGVIPGDVQDLAVAECEKTLKDGSGKPLEDRIRDMVIAFKDQGVTQAMLEARLQHPVAACTSANVVALSKIFLSIRDGISKREDWFDLNAGKPETTGESSPKSRTDAAKSKLKKPEPEPQQDEEKPPASFQDQIVAAQSVMELEQIKKQYEAAGISQEEQEMLNSFRKQRIRELAAG